MIEKKNGDVRICIDPKYLNMAIKREHFQIPTKEEILGELAGTKYFSKMDAKAGFHRIELDEKSSMMTTFNTPFGRYRYLRLPIGILSARKSSTIRCTSVSRTSMAYVCIWTILSCGGPRSNSTMGDWRKL